MKKFVLGMVVGMVAAGLLVLCFILGTKVANKENKEENKPKETENEVVELKYDDKLVKQAFAMMPDEFCGGYNYRFDGTSRTVDKFKNTEKIAMLFNMFKDEVYDVMDKYYYEDEDKAVVVLEEKDFKKYFEDLSFLKDVKKEKDGYGLTYPAVLKYKNDKYYLYPYPTGCTGPGNDAGYIFFDKATKEGNTLKVRFAYVYIKYTFNEKKEEFVEHHYRAAGDKKEAPKKLEYDYETGRVTGDGEGYDRYEAVFDLSDGNFRIQAINFIKSE